MILNRFEINRNNVFLWVNEIQIFITNLDHFVKKDYTSYYFYYQVNFYSTAMRMIDPHYLKNLIFHLIYNYTIFQNCLNEKTEDEQKI